ncbi:hypothetical protein LINPERPRIM_LOCUS24830, partial [Linum perenne]
NLDLEHNSSSEGSWQFIIRPGKDLQKSGMEPLYKKLYDKYTALKVRLFEGRKHLNRIE